MRTKLEAVMPAKLTEDIVCILEGCDPEHQADETIERLMFDYQPMWDRLRAKLLARNGATARGRV